MAALETELKEKTETAAKLEAQLKEKTETIARLETELKEKTETAATLETQLKETSDTAAELGKGSDSLSAQLTEVQAAKAELEGKLKATEDSLAGVQTELEEKTREAETLSKESAELSAQLKESQNAKTALEKQLADTQAESAAAGEKAQAEKTALEKQLADTQAEAAAAGEKAQAEKTALEKQLADTQAEAENVKTSLEGSIAALQGEAVERENEIGEIKKQLADTEADAAELRAVIEAEEARKAALPVLEEEVASADGQTTISWSGNKDVSVVARAVNGSAQQPARNLGVSDTGSLASGLLMPGKTYKVELSTAGSEDLVEQVYTVPAADDFTDGLMTRKSAWVNVQTGYMPAGAGLESVRRISRLSAAEMATGIQEGGSYGCLYRVNTARLARARNYHVTVFIEAPNGYLDSVYDGDVAFGVENCGEQGEWLIFLGGDYFTELYETAGEIPTGGYTITMFWDGMLTTESLMNIYK